MARKTKCPWCNEKVKEEDYSEHLEKHYKLVDIERDGKTVTVKVGPFPAIEVE